MAGPNLEVFKFAVYVFFPVLVFLHYGDPEWYQTNVIPVGTSNQLGRVSCNHRNVSIKNEYSPLKRGRRAITTFQLTMRPCAKNSSASRRRKQHGARSVSRRPQETPTRAKELKGWCSWRGSQVRPISYLYIGATCEPDFQQLFHCFSVALLPLLPFEVPPPTKSIGTALVLDSCQLARPVIAPNRS